MSDAFVLSQREYYRQHLRCGPSRDWNLICGLYQYYSAECRKRGLLK